jgi:hypothetical protein
MEFGPMTVSALSARLALPKPETEAAMAKLEAKARSYRPFHSFRAKSKPKIE